MGCFTACFRHSKHKKIIKSGHNAIPPSKNQCLQSLLHSHDVDEVIIKEAQTEDAIKPIADSKDEEELNRSSRKKVTFDLSVKTYEECSNQEDQKKAGENEAEKSSDSYPLNHRYHNCSTKGDDEELEEDLGLEEIDLEDDGNGLIQEESSESLFSLSIESRKSVSQPEMPDKEEVSSTPLKNPFQEDAKTNFGLNPNARDRTQFAQSVLNPIENMSQWKTAKAKTASSSPLQPQEKENQNLDLKSKENEIAVDTSLSSWLIGSKNSSESIGNSPSDQRRKYPKEFEVLSKSSSPRRSPRCSADDMAIIGTVGSYWRHTGQATDSDSGSSCRGVSGGSRRRRNVNQSPTPFQTRLESAVQD